MSTPKSGSISKNIGASNLGSSKLAAPKAAPKTSFADALAGKMKKAADAVEKATDPAAAEAAAEIAEAERLAREELELQMVKSIIQNPKAGQIDREKAVNPDDD